MAGKITALVFQKKNRERVNIFIEDAFALAVSLNTALTLKKGQVLTDDDIARLKAEDAVNRAYHRALSYLSYRARSRHEVVQYLQQKNVPPEAIEAAVERLEQNNYLNDAEFGRAWVASRSRQNPKGRQALRYELQQKGLSRDDIEQALRDLDEEPLAWRAVQKQLSRWKGLDRQTFWRKLNAHLARRGFAHDVIQTTFYRAWNTNTDSNERNN